MRGLLLSAAAGVLALALTGSAQAAHHGGHHGSHPGYYGGRHAYYGGHRGYYGHRGCYNRSWYYGPGWGGYYSPGYYAPLSSQFYLDRWGFSAPYNPFAYPGCR